MRNADGRTGALVLFVAVLCAAPSFAQDWPQWRGPNRDGKVTGFAAPQTWPKALTPTWKATVGEGDSTPSLVGDRLYVCARQGNDELVLCLNAADGKEVWRHKFPAPEVRRPASSHAGPRSSPAVADGKVVSLAVGGTLLCLDAADGKVLWTKDPFPKAVPQFFTAMSPIVLDGLAIAHLGGRGKGALIAYDLASGAEKWRWGGEGPEYASPVVLTVDGAKQLVTLTEKSIVGVGAADGKLLWQLPFAPASRAPNVATPIVDGQTVIYMGAKRGMKAARIAKQGDTFAATELWSNAEIATSFNTPVLRDGLLFGMSDRGNLFCVKAQDGKVAWTDTAKHGRGFAGVVDAGSVLLALPSTSELIAYKPSGEKYEEVARIKVAETPTYAHPVVAGNRILVKDKETLTLFTLQ